MDRGLPKPGANGARPCRGFGVAGALSHDVVRELARTAECAGYRTVWVNDAPDGDGLAALREAAAVTTSIRPEALAAAAPA